MDHDVGRSEEPRSVEWGPAPALPPSVNDRSMHFVARWQDGNDLVAVVGFDGHFIWLNDACAEWMGWSQATMRSVDWWEFVHPDHQDNLVIMAEALMNRGEFMAVPVLALRADGRYEWLIFDYLGDTDTERMFGVASPSTPDGEQTEQIIVGEWVQSGSTSEFTADPGAAELLGLPPCTPVPTGDLLDRVASRDRTRLRRALQVDLARAESIGETVHIVDHEQGAEKLVRLAGGPIRTPDRGRRLCHGLVRQARRNDGATWLPKTR
jgi:PAS domain S-box-containing protein